MIQNVPNQLEGTQNTQKLKRKRMSLKRRIALSIVLFLVLFAVVAGTFYIFRPRVQPLSLPTLPKNLTVEQLGLTDWQSYQQALPAHPLAGLVLQSSPQVDAGHALFADAVGSALIQQGKFDQGIAYLKAAAQSDPNNLRYANDVRVALRNHGRYDDEEKFFTALMQQQKTPNTAIDLALTYVDEMRSCPKPPDGLVCQAQDSYRSITTLNGVIDQQPYNVVARFARGLNNLYWPTLMGHLPQAQKDLQYAVALTKPLNAIGNSFAPQAYVALGDVFAKDGKTDQARNVWLNGKNVVPNASLLVSRLNIPEGQLQSEEDNTIRGLGVYVDTDIALFWSK